MSKKVSTILIIVLALALAGAGLFIYNNNRAQKELTCINGETAIYEYYKSAVVLVKHKFSYKISVKHCTPFTLHTDDGDLAGSEVSGTGFFVSKDGKIVTNRHVVQPWTAMSYDPSQYLKAHIASILPDSVASDSVQAFLERHWGNYDDDEQEYNANADTAKQPAADTSKAGVADNTAEHTDSSSKTVAMVKEQDIEVVPVSDEISVALHGSMDEWLPCKLVTFSKEDGVDIGILQLTSEKLPRSVDHLVDLQTAITDDASLRPGNKAILVGYPMGTELANTRRGILVQAYEGQINKESDGTTLQYNVTSTHGASGSPVFNECGQLIAVNYAGVDATQGYNFGIVARYAKELVR